jgi:hypothetical protein
MWKEAVTVYFKALSQNLPGHETEERPSVGEDLRVEIRTQDVLNTKQECYPLHHGDQLEEIILQSDRKFDKIYTCGICRHKSKLNSLFL